jgi:putative tricarboxylic transport membrane protein
MNLKVLIEGILALVFGLVAMVEGLRLILRKDPYVLYDPLGPGLYVLLLGLGLMAVSVVHFVANHRKFPGKGRVTASKKMRGQLFSSIGILALYILLVYFVGYLVATLTFFLLELKVSGVKSWLTNIILTLVLTIIYYVIFVKFCGMVFPKGIFFL